MVGKVILLTEGLPFGFLLESHLDKKTLVTITKRLTDLTILFGGFYICFIMFAVAALLKLERIAGNK